MWKESVNEDKLGRKFGERYSTILTDPTFERRLKLFDPSLKLMFDQVKKRWRILEWAPDNSGWNILMTAEENGEPRPLGEWVFNTLYVWRHNYNLKRDNPEQYWNDLMHTQKEQVSQLEAKHSDDGKHRILEERNEWRKAARELKNFPKSDVTAGYPKSGKVFEQLETQINKETQNASANS